MKFQLAFERLDVIGDNLGSMSGMAIYHKKYGTPAAAQEVAQKDDEAPGIHFAGIDVVPERDPLLDRIQADESVPVLARELFAAQAEEYAQLRAQIAEVDAKLMAWHKADECGRRLAYIPGIGPIGATLLMMKTPAPEMFRSGRQFAAWIGLTPKDHSTAGKVRLGVITMAGDEALRSVLVVGATAVIQHGRRGGRGSPWIVNLLKRKPPKLAAVALANKMARIAWKLMVTGNSYAAKSAPAAMGAA